MIWIWIGFGLGWIWLDFGWIWLDLVRILAPYSFHSSRSSLGGPRELQVRSLEAPGEIRRSSGPRKSQEVLGGPRKS